MTSNVSLASVSPLISLTFDLNLTCDLTCDLCAHRLLRQESNVQYGLKGRDARVRWYVFGHPKPDVRVTFNKEEIQPEGRYSLSYSSAGELTLGIAR